MQKSWFSEEQGSGQSPRQSPERQLLETLQRVSRQPDNWRAVVLHLSRLSPLNRRDQHIRIAARMIEGVLAPYNNHLFVLGSNDIVFLVQNSNPVELDTLVYRLRALFANDPLVSSDPGDGRDPFSSGFDLEKSLGTFLGEARTLAENAHKNRAGGVVVTPVTPETLGTAILTLENTSVREAIRRQPVIQIVDEGRRGVVLFQEFFCLVSALQPRISPGVSLTADRWLFQELSVVLDRKMLAAIQGLGLESWPPAVSLNVNLQTVDSGALDTLGRTLNDRHVNLVLEFQVMDIFADLGRFFRVRDRLRAAGHQVVLDGLTAMTVQFVDLAALDPDLLKMMWTPELAVQSQPEGPMAQAVEALGPHRVILARCDTDAAVRWGRNLGLERFQGHFVDALFGAMVVARCGNGCTCGLKGAVDRRARITGDRRQGCRHPALLDSWPDVMVP